MPFIGYKSCRQRYIEKDVIVPMTPARAQLIWREIQDWYYAHGFFLAASNMTELKRTWRDAPQLLLASLHNYDLVKAA